MRVSHDCGSVVNTQLPYRIFIYSGILYPRHIRTHWFRCCLYYFLYYVTDFRFRHYERSILINCFSPFFHYLLWQEHFNMVLLICQYIFEFTDAFHVKFVFLNSDRSCAFRFVFLFYVILIQCKVLALELKNSNVLYFHKSRYYELCKSRAVLYQYVK